MTSQEEKDWQEKEREMFENVFPSMIKGDGGTPRWPDLYLIEKHWLSRIAHHRKQAVIEDRRGLREKSKHMKGYVAGKGYFRGLKEGDLLLSYSDLLALLEE